MIKFTEVVRAEHSQFPGAYSRRLQRYGVGVYEREFNELLEYGALEMVAGRFYVVREEAFKRHYSREIRLNQFMESIF